MSKEIDTVLLTSLKNEEFIQEIIINKTRSDIYLDILNEKNSNLNNLFNLFLNSTFPTAIEKNFKIRNFIPKFTGREITIFRFNFTKNNRNLYGYY